MTTQLTPNLRLRLTPEMTADSQYNLLRIDSLGSRFVVGQDENVYVRSIGNVYIQPESPDVGGTDVGGLLILGDDDRTLANSIDVESWSRSFQLTGALRLANDAGTFYLGFQAPTLLASTTWTLPPADGLANSALTTDGAGILAWTPVTGLLLPALPQFNMWIGNVANQATPTDTSALGDISANIASGLSIKASAIVNAMVSPSAAIAYTKLALTNSIVNADINAAAAVAYSKLNLLGSVTNADLAGSIAYSKLILTNSIVNADVNAAAAIAYAKLNLLGSVTNADLAGSIAYSKLVLTNSIVDADINAAAAVAYSKLALSNSILNADINASAAIAYSKLAALTISRALVSDGAGVVSVSAVTSAELGFVSGVTSSIQTQLNTKMSGIGSATGATAGSVLFAGAAGILAQDNAQFFWDDTNNRLGLGTAVPSATLHVAGQSRVAQTGTGTAFQVTHAGTSGTTLSLSQTDITNNSNAMAITNAGSGNSVNIQHSGTGTVLALGGASTAARLQLQGSTSGNLNIAVPAAVTTHTITLPATQGAASSRLTNDGTGILSWVQVPSDIIAIAGASYTVLATDDILYVSTAGVCSIQLPTPTVGRQIRIKDIAGTRETAAITLLRAAAETIDGLAASRLLQSNYGQWKIESNGTNWFITG